MLGVSGSDEHLPEYSSDPVYQSDEYAAESIAAPPPWIPTYLINGITIDPTVTQPCVLWPHIPSSLPIDGSLGGPVLLKVCSCQLLCLN